MSALTIQDLREALEDERHLGWGYSGVEYLDESRREKLDAIVVEVANELGLNRERLFHWTNSKWGRWLADDAEGRRPTVGIVRRYLSEETVASALEGMEEIR